MATLSRRKMLQTPSVPYVVWGLHSLPVRSRFSTLGVAPLKKNYVKTSQVFPKSFFRFAVVNVRTLLAIPGVKLFFSIGFNHIDPARLRYPIKIPLKGYFYIATFCLFLTACAGKGNDSFSSILRQWEDEPEASKLIDFSYAGYKRNEEKPVLIPDHYQRFDVTDYGAIPNDGQDDIDAIQRAVDAASEAGGGEVFIPKGTFDFDVNTKKRFVHIRHSNITILGSGDGEGWTILYDHTASDYPDPAKKWLSGLWPSFFLAYKLDADSVWTPFEDENNIAAELGNASKNSIALPVMKDIGVEEGQTYLLTMESKDNSLTKEIIYPLAKAAKYWWSEEGDYRYKIRHLVTVVKKNESEIELDAPLLWALDEKYSPKLWSVPIMLDNIAIAGIKMTTNWSDHFIHHLNSVHDGGWGHIRMSYCENSWVQNTEHVNTTGAVGLNNSKNCAVFHARIKGNIGHNGFNISGFSTRNLLYNLHGGQAFHTFALSSHSSGNVYYNCYSDEPTGIDLHGGIGVHNLYDNISGPQFRHGGSGNALPPATGHGFAMWNYQVGVTEPYKGIVKNSIANIKEIPGFTLVGVQGAKGQEVYLLDEDKNRIDYNYNGPWGQIEYWQEMPNPRSLFRYQLARRMGRGDTSDSKHEVMNRREFINRTSLAAVGSAGLASSRVAGHALNIREEAILPNAAQNAWMDLGFGMFVHFGINTYYDKEWSDGTLDPVAVKPDQLDTDQWCRTAKEAGMKYIV